MSKFKPPHDHDLMVNSAVRYALGRRTYIGSSICHYIVTNFDILTERCKEVIVNDINDALKRKDMGDKCDEIQWLSLKKFIENRKTVL